MVRPTGALYAEHLPGMSDDELFKEMCDSTTPGSINYQMCEGELNRRFLARVEKAVDRLHESSLRLERLTFVVAALTVVLLLLAAPPAWDAIAKIIGR